MTMFVNGSFGLPVTIHAANDVSNCDQIFWSPLSRAPVRCAWANELRNRTDNANDNYVFSTRWWPRSASIIMGGWIGTADDMFQNKAPRWIAPNTTRGANGRLAFVGITRNQYGSALANCTVRLYRVATEEQQCKVTSDGVGKYFATTPYNDAHFMVIHNSAGDQAGATANTILPG